MKTKISIAILIACASISAYSQDWIKVAKGDSITYSIQSGSVEIAKTRGGDLMVVGTGKSSNSITNTHIGELWYVTAKHCALGRGKLVTLDPAGEFKYDNDFVSGLGTVASTIAETLCTVARSENKKTPSTSV